MKLYEIVKEMNVPIDQMKGAPSLEELSFRFLQQDTDGVSTEEEKVLRAIYGPKEACWRNQRNFFGFCAAHGATRETLVVAGQSAVEAARVCGETEDYVQFYWHVVVAETVRHASR